MLVREGGGVRISDPARDDPSETVVVGALGKHQERIFLLSLSLWKSTGLHLEHPQPPTPCHLSWPPATRDGLTLSWAAGIRAARRVGIRTVSLIRSVSGTPGLGAAFRKEGQNWLLTSQLTWGSPGDWTPQSSRLEPAPSAAERESLPGLCQPSPEHVFTSRLGEAPVQVQRHPRENAPSLVWDLGPAPSCLDKTRRSELHEGAPWSWFSWLQAVTPFSTSPGRGSQTWLHIGITWGSLKTTAPTPSPRCSDLIGIGCDLATGVFKFPQVILMCTQVWEPMNKFSWDQAQLIF